MAISEAKTGFLFFVDPQITIFFLYQWTARIGEGFAPRDGCQRAITSCTLTDMTRIQAAVTHFSQLTTP